MIDEIIKVVNLSKSYRLKGGKKKKGSLEALNNINFSIKEGEIFGFLGPNGAGKTTLIKILTTILQPTTGYALIDGINIVKNPYQAKKRISLMLDSQMLYNRITGYDNLKWFAKLYRVENSKEKIHDILRDFELEQWAKQYVEYYSNGMKMRLALARTIMLDRKILILDEPTVGLDVKAAAFIVDKLKEIEKTIFITSHDMGVVEKLCDRIAFIDKGKIIKIGTKEDVTKLGQEEIFFEILLNHNINELFNELQNQNYIQKIEKINNGIEVSIKNRNNLKQLFLNLSKYDIHSFREKEISLEQLFLNLY